MTTGRAGWRPPPAAELAWHPATLLALAVLLANDHLLKPWGGCPWLSGKLSDVAGLFLLPVALFVVASFLVRRHLRTAATACALAVGVCFALVKTWPAFNAVYTSGISAALGAVGLGHYLRIRVDPTDLLALPALAAAWWLMQRGIAPRKTIRVPKPATRTAPDPDSHRSSCRPR